MERTGAYNTSRINHAQLQREDELSRRRQEEKLKESIGNAGTNDGVDGEGLPENIVTDVDIPVPELNVKDLKIGLDR